MKKLAAAFLLAVIGFAASPVRADDGQNTTVKDDQARCLAKNIYHESRGEGATGMVAVANVTLNRVREDDDQPCHVVYERNRVACQFEWTCHAFLAVEKDRDSWEKALAVAHKALEGKLDDVTSGATSFRRCASRMSLKGLKLTRVIGHHCFFQPRDSEGKGVYDPDHPHTLSTPMNLSYTFMKNDEGYSLVPRGERLTL